MLNWVEFGPWFVTDHENEYVPLLFLEMVALVKDNAASVLSGWGWFIVLPRHPELFQVKTQPWVAPLPM
jgi:hypothetical protein